MREFSPEVWKSLTNDKELTYGTWETPRERIHTFVGRQGGAFRVLVKGMYGLSPEQGWKVLAMKSLLERNDKDFKRPL